MHKKRMKRTKKALDFFDQGFSCSQSILSFFAPGLGLSRIQALRIASAFGGGICRRGEMCGAITGGIMVIGLKYGRTKANDTAAKEKTYRMAEKYMRWFEKRYGTMLCRELTRWEKHKNQVGVNKYHADICREIVPTAEIYLRCLLK